MSKQLYRKVAVADGWSTKTWSGLTNFTPTGIWSDGDNIYYSANSSQYVLNKATGTWTAKTWNGFTPTYGYAIWSAGGNIYYSYRSDQYVLNKATSTWTAKTWNGFYPNNITASDKNYVWSDGTNTYWSYSSSQQYIFNATTAEWEEKTWNGLTSFKGNSVWTDGEDIYYSSYSEHYILDKATDTWLPKTWNGLSSFRGDRVWTDGENTYCCNDVLHESYQCILDKSTSTWLPKTWNKDKNLSSGISGEYVWSDGEHTYYSTGSNHYILDMLIIYKQATEQLYEKISDVEKWSAKTWTGLSSFQGRRIWSDGTDIYYSLSENQYKYNKSTDSWDSVTWNISNLDGMFVWSDGTDTYYSSGLNSQYKLNKSTGTWTAVTWSGYNLTTSSGIWHDENNVYYSSGSDQYVLNKSTGEWTAKTWNGLSNFSGEYVWSDGTDTYCSSPSLQYKLNRATDTWEAVTWNISGVNGTYIWNYDSDTYFSNGSSQYMLNKTTGEWEAKEWTGLASFAGYHVWSDGENTYYSQSSNQFRLDRIIEYEPTVIPEGIKVKDAQGVWHTIKGVSVNTHGAGPADIAALPPTGAYISSYDQCLAFLGIDEMPKYIGTNNSDTDPWKDCSGDYIAEQKAYLSGNPYYGPNSIGSWYFLKVGDKVLAKSDMDSGFASLIEFTEVPITDMSLTIDGVAATPGSVIIPSGENPTLQVTTSSDSTKQYFYCNSDWFGQMNESTTDSIGTAYIGGSTLLVEVDPTNHTIGIEKYVYEEGN